MQSLKELEAQFDLSNWKRSLGSKRTKAGKYFWLCVLFNYKEAMKGNIPLDMQMVCEEYRHIFYRPYAAISNMLTLYEGQPTAEMRRKLLIEEWKDMFTIKFKLNSLELEDKLRAWLNNFDGSFDHIAPEVVDLIDLDFLDHRQPHLPLVSQSYKRLLDSAKHSYGENTLPIDPRWELKPSTVKNTFGKTMDAMLHYETLIHVVDHLRDYLNTSFEIFRVKNRVEGPTEAVREILAINPELAEYTDKQFKYHLQLKYADRHGEDFSADSLRKAIKRNRDAQPS